MIPQTLDEIVAEIFDVVASKLRLGCPDRARPEPNRAEHQATHLHHRRCAADPKK